MARCLAVNQAFRSFAIKPQHPIPDHLEPNPADPRRIRPRRAIIDFGQGKKAAALCRILRGLGQSPQTRTIKVFPQSNRCTHGEPPRLFAPLIQTFARLGNPPRESPLPQLSISPGGGGNVAPKGAVVHAHVERRLANNGHGVAQSGTLVRGEGTPDNATLTRHDGGDPGRNAPILP